MVNAEVIAFNLDQKGNIVVQTSYTVNGVEVPSDYPKVNNRYVYVTRYDVMNFHGMTQDQIKNRIMEDIQNHVKALVSKTFIKKQNFDIVSSGIPGLIGSKIDLSEADVTVTDSNGKAIKQMTVRTDGTFTEKALPSSVPV